MLDAETILRYEARAALFPPGSACAYCGTTCPLLFVLRRRPVLCATCSARARGRSGFEDHHLGGRLSPLPLVRVTINTHRLLTFIQDATWRGRFASGSAIAVAIDLVAWAVAYEEGYR